MNNPLLQGQKIHLILGSGGARGLVHIGVIRYLESQNIEIGRITGCSMGALIGALYAVGKLDEYEAWVTQLSKFNVLQFLDISLTSRNGFLKGDKIMEQLRGWIGDVKIEELGIPFEAVSADIMAQKEVWFDQGNLMDAVRASISVPGIFTPLLKNQMVLVDGGILNPLPIPPASIHSNHTTLAVSLAGRPVKQPFGKSLKAVSNSSKNKSILPYQQKVENFLTELQEAFGLEDTQQTETSAKEDSLSFIDIMMGMFNTMQDSLARYQLAGNPPDILIEIPTNICESHEFYKASPLIEAGEFWAQKALKEQIQN